MPREDYPEIMDLFYLLEEIDRGKYTFNIFNGNKEKHGIKFMLISIIAKDSKAYEQLITIMNDVSWTDIYEGSTNSSSYTSTTAKTIRIIIFFEEKIEQCGFGLASFIEKTPNNIGSCCEDICNEHNTCKKQGRPYSIRIKGDMYIQKNASIQERFEEDLFLDSMLEATKFTTIMKELIFHDAKNIVLNYHPRVYGP